MRLEALSQLGLLKLLMSANNVSAHNVEFVITGKRITSEAAEAAEKIGIRLIKLPANINLEETHVKPSTAPVKLTSPKSWQVISYLLKTKETSIRQLAIKSNVSYGWTHATIQALVSKGIVSGSDGYVKITDINKLLNGIAWERPFEKLFAQEIRIAANSPIALAQEICLICDEQQIPCAFTSFTAGEIYTGYSARHDSAYLYLEKKNIAELKGYLMCGMKEESLCESIFQTVMCSRIAGRSLCIAGYMPERRMIEILLPFLSEAVQYTATISGMAQYILIL